MPVIRAVLGADRKDSRAGLPAPERRRYSYQRTRSSMAWLISSNSVLGS